MAHALPSGYTSRRPTHDDAAGIAELIGASQRAYGDDDPVVAEEIVNDWDGLDLATEALLVTTDRGVQAAYADVDNRGNVIVAVYGYVHPDHQRRGLGTALVRWGEAVTQACLDDAPPGMRVVTQHYIPAANTAGRELMDACGYHPERTVYKMGITLDAPPDAPEEIGGVRLRDFVPGRDERATFDAMEEAFADTWGRAPNTFERWLETSTTDRATPWFWHLAEDLSTGEVAGACLGHAAGGQGWIGGVGVRPVWRRRGIAEALLARAFATYHRHGIDEVGLSVDSESSTGAPRLYIRAGMHNTQSYLVYRKTLRQGMEPAGEGGAE